MRNWAFIFLIWSANFGVYAQEAQTYQYKELNGEMLKLDVYKPLKQNSQLSPVIIFFHGGGLVAGNKEQMKKQCLFFSERGFVTVSANYHLLPKGDSIAQNQVSQCIKDAKTAVRWVKQNSKRLGIDSAMVLLSGGSAGGFLATQVALNDDINESSDNFEISTKAKALILYNPAYTPVKKYHPDVLNVVSKKSPPAILFYGDGDKFKPGGQVFFNKLKRFGITSELWLAQGEAHGFFNKQGWGQATNIKAFNFLSEKGLATGATERENSGFILIKN